VSDGPKEGLETVVTGIIFALGSREQEAAFSHQDVQAAQATSMVQLKTLTSPPATKDPSRVKTQHNHAKQASNGPNQGLETVISIILVGQQRTNSYTSGFVSSSGEATISSELWQVHPPPRNSEPK
jgi:hypothetical protein